MGCRRRVFEDEGLPVRLKVINDLKYGCINNIQEYTNFTKDSQYQEDILIVATDNRGVFKDFRKRALAASAHCKTV